MEATAEPSYGIAPTGHRLPPGTHVGAVRLQVRDLQRSVDYYERVVGLREQSRAADVISLGASDAGHPLVHLHGDGRVRPARRGALGLYHFALLLPDRAALARFTRHIAALGLRVGMADHLVSEALYLTDPDGLGIEVYADRPRASWRQRDRELVMTTEPLDVEDLTAAAGAEPWTGAPAGTTIGHMHLHVGSLEAASSFYHSALGFDQTVWSYPGAVFLSAGGYHHHLGTNIWSPGPSASEDEARLLEWEVMVPRVEDVRAAATSLREHGYPTEDAAGDCTTPDPWGTRLRITAQG